MADKDTLDSVADTAVAASDTFKARYPEARTSVGVISSTVRKMGVNADAVNIDCLHSGQRLVLIVLDQNPEMVGIGIGQKDTIGNYQLIKQVSRTELAVSDVLQVLEARFAKQLQ